MKNKNKQGISLIVLVLTIIIMIILAAAVIITLNNSDIIERADEAVAKTDAAQLQQLASIAWAEAYADGVKNGKTLSQKDLEDAVNDYLIDNGYSETTLNNYDINVTTEGVVVSQKGSAIPPKEPSEQEKFDQGFLAVQEQLLAENNNVMPEAFIYGDYEYGFNKEMSRGKGKVSWSSSVNEAQDGWSVKLIDRTKKEYGPILTSAFGKAVKNLFALYYNCGELETVPVIPSGVTKVNNMFEASNLISLPLDFAIPSGVTSANKVFYNCTNITGTLEINSTTTNYVDMFSGTTQPIILTTTSSEVTREYLEALAATSTNGNVTVDPAIQ